MNSATPLLPQAAQEKLRSNQQLLRAIFDGALEPMVLTDADGKYVDANPAACELYAVPLEQLVGRSISELNGVDWAGEAAQQAFRERGKMRGTFALERADGSRRTLEFSSVSNVALGLDLSVMRDITDRVTAEAALQSSEARFRTLTEKSSDVIALIARDGSILYASPSLTRMLGWSAEELARVDPLIHIFPADRARLAIAYDRLLRETEEVALELRAVHRDGSLRWIEVSARNLFGDPNVGAIVANLRDITERIASQDALRASHDLLEEAQAIAHVGSWTSGSNSEGQIVWSSQCYRIFGVPEHATVTVASFFEHVHPEDRDRVRHMSLAAWEGKAPYEVAHRIVRADGSVRWVHERAIVERDEAGNPTRMIGTVQDITERRLALEALRTSEGEFRQLADAMPQIVWITRPDGGNAYCNQHWVAYTGLSLEESHGDQWIRAVHPHDRQRAWLAWQDARSSVGTYTLECRLRRADGVYRWWLVRGVPVLDESGGILKWFGTCTDVDGLKQERERLHVLHHIAEVMLTQADSLQAVSAALQVLGRHLQTSHCAYATLDADGEHCDIVHDYAEAGVRLEGRHRLDAMGARFVAEGELRAMILVQPTSPRDWTLVEVSIIEEVRDRCAAAIEKGAVDAMLRQNEALLRTAGRAARLGGWSVSLPELRLTWSDEVCAIHEVRPGCTPTVDEAISYYAPEFREVIRDKVTTCLGEGIPFDLELQIITATGRRMWVRAIGQAERSASGAITMLLGAFQDIDDRRKLQDQFRQAQKMEAVGRLAGGIAHDFNNLLSVILSYSDLAIESLKQGDPLRDDIEEVRNAGRRATALTRQLLAFSRQQVLEPHVIDLDEIVGKMKPMLCRLLGEDVEVAVPAAQFVGHVLADPSQIEQVVMNLAVNARDAMPDGGKLTISTCSVSVGEGQLDKPDGIAPGAFVVLVIADSGVGMTEATLARAFEPFFTTKAKGKGTGLGLATVFGIVQQSGGYVSVHSELGKGTTFKVYLPRTDRAVEVSVSVPPATELHGSETILLVEDEDQVRTVACTILRRHGYNVLETSNGGEAYLVSSDFAAKIDLLLTDVIMPRMSGRRLAEQLMLQRPEMKVLFASGYTDDAIIHHGVLEAGVDLLQKPFTPRSLLKKVRDALDAGGSQREGRHAARRL